MVTHEEGFEPQHPSADLRRSAFVNLDQPGEGPTYGADDCLTDFDCLDGMKGGDSYRGTDVYMNVEGVWYMVTRWDTAEREVYVMGKGIVEVIAGSRFIVSSKERHLTKVR